VQSTLDDYLTRLDAYPPLSSVDLYALAVRARQGDKHARERLIQHHLRLVVSIAKRYLRHTSDPMDLIQAGNLGLIEAVDRYDPDRGALSTYASPWIEKYVRQAAQEDQELPLPDDLAYTPRDPAPDDNTRARTAPRRRRALDPRAPRHHPAPRGRPQRAAHR
jgi:hypothetical protein